MSTFEVSETFYTLGSNILFNWFGRSPKKSGLVGITIGVEGIALAYIPSRQSATQPVTEPFSSLKYIEFTPCENSPEAQLKALRGRVEALGLSGAPCNLVMASGQYQLLLVEAPNVPATELRDAMRFRVRDLISFPVDEAIIDAAPLPADAGRGGQSMAYVVAGRQSSLLPVIELVNNAGLFLQTIDIEEMALRNLAIHAAEEGRAVALVKLHPGGGVISLVREGFLYLARRFDLAYGGGLLDDLPEDNLALELQRSLDYFERQMGQAPPNCIYVCGENLSEDKLSAGLRQSLAVPLRLLPLADWVPEGVAEENLLQLCAPAIGGCFRVEVDNDA